jgi:hypothetical protein
MEIYILLVKLFEMQQQSRSQVMYPRKPERLSGAASLSDRLWTGIIGIRNAQR